MEFEIEIAQSEDHLWRFRLTRDEIWTDGFWTYWKAYEAAVIELAKKVCKQP
jgi:hypothetical protein